MIVTITNTVIKKLKIMKKAEDIESTVQYRLPDWY